ncbi:MAG TPA: hypothetical protein VFB33_10650 [Candidatus Binataceae bacterium]|nr:hypothetical protein [Candidatus Binataceae bacterium]
MGFGGKEALSTAAAAAGHAMAEPCAAAAPPVHARLLRYSPAMVLLAALIADSNRHTDPDLWGHLRFGRDFIAAHGLLRHDSYSYSAAGHLWRDHEWLAEVVMALVYDAAGLVGLKLWKFACSALTIVLMAESEAETGAGVRLQFFVTLIAALGLILQSQFRPQMFSFVMLAGLLTLLARENYRRDAPLWFVIPLFALWANLHGGFFIGVAALALYTVVAAISDLAAGAGARRGLRLGSFTAAAAAATLLNPYGVGMWETVAHALRNPYTRAVVTDWQPSFHAMISQWHSAHSGVLLYLVVFGMVVGLGVAFVAQPRGDDLPLVAVAAMMAAAALVSVRNLALAVIALSGPLARHLTLVLERRRGGFESQRHPRVNHWVVLALCAGLAIQGGLFSTRLASDQPYPAGALAFMGAHDLSGNVLADFGWGEYVIWHAVPPDRVFIDGRYDTLYPLHVIRDYLEFYFDRPGAHATLNSYPHDFVLIGPHTPAAKLMARRGDWTLLYRDSAALLYARANSPAARIPGLPVNGVALAAQFP